MSKELTVSATAFSKAPRSIVFDLLATSARWNEWAPLSKVALETPGEDGKDGVGAIKKITVLGSPSKERILEVVPGKKIKYTYIAGALHPFITDYVGEAELEDKDGGTQIDWHASFRHKFTGSGFGPALILKVILPRLTNALASYADSISATAG